MIGLPIVATLAWSYEITPGGIVLDDGTPDGVKLPRARRAVAPADRRRRRADGRRDGLRLVDARSQMGGTAGVPAGRCEPVMPSDRGAAARGHEPVRRQQPTSETALAEGICRCSLAQVPGLRVAARTSAFEFKDRNVDVRSIGQSLGVRHVLEGSVRRDGDNLRVTMQLINAANGFHVWAGTYDRRIGRMRSPSRTTSRGRLHADSRWS